MKKKGNDKRKGKGKARKQHQVSMRSLSEDFQELDEELLPEYKKYVRRVLTIDSMKDKLRNHCYRSMASFTKDFYEMLNNGRSVTELNSLVILFYLSCVYMFVFLALLMYNFILVLE